MAGGGDHLSRQLGDGIDVASLGSSLTAVLETSSDIEIRHRDRKLSWGVFASAAAVDWTGLRIGHRKREESSSDRWTASASWEGLTWLPWEGRG